MFKSARSRLRAAVFACAAALGLGAYAATPIAVWDGNFSESDTINGATFNANGNTVAEDGSYVKITGEKGAVFTLNKSYRYITAVFTVSNLNETAAYDRALATVGGGTLFGAYLQSGTLTTHGINGNAIWPTANASDYSSYDATLTSYAGASTQRTFSLTQAHSSNSYNGTHLYEVYGGNTAAAIKFGGSGNNGLRAGQAYSKVVIGGMESYTEGTTLFRAASDLVILKVALYASDSTFPIAQADYATYSMPSMTVVTTPSTMSALNTAVAASSDAVALSDVSATITLDEEPSGATKSILQSAYWQGTVLIKDADKNNIVPSNYGNPNSTLKLSGVKGYFAAQQFNSSATPAIELEDSETDGREYGLWQNNGYSFYSGTSSTYQYVNTPELKGSGTYKIDTAETSSLFVADKFSNFTGKLEVTYGAVWLGVAVPSRDVAGRELVKVGTVRVSEAFVNAPLSQWTGWTVANGYLGDITVAAGSTNNYTDNRVNFLKADSWKGTVTISTATNNTNGHVEIWLSKLGGANSTIVINDLVSGSKDYYLNEGNYQNNPTFVSTIDINGDVQFKNGSSSQTVTFDKVTSDSATDKLTFAFPTSATLNFKINSLDNFAGTLSASSSTPLTIVDILKTGAAEGSLLVKVDENNANIASLSDTTLNGESADLELKNGTDGYGIYVAESTIDVTVPVVANTVVTVTVGGETVSPTVEGGNVYKVAPGSFVTVTYAAADGYEISGTTVYTVDTVSATTFEVTDTATAQYVAQIKTGSATYEKYTTLAAALASENIAYGITLLSDVFEASVTVSSNVRITGGNHTISSDIAVANGGQLILTSATLDGTLTIQNGGTYETNGGALGEVVVQNGGIINLTTLSEDAAPLTVSTLTVNGALTIVSTYGGAVRGTTYKAISYATEAATIAEGASFNGKDEWTASTVVDGDNTVVCLEITKVAVVDGVYYDTAQEAVEAAVAGGKQAQFLVQPGTVTLGAGETLVVKGAYQPTVELDAGLTAPQYEVESTYDLETFIYTYAVKSYVAQIGNTKYESLADAVAAATSGQTVTLLADVTLNSTLTLPAGKTLTMDLGGFTIYSGNDSSKRIVVNGTVTMTNGVVDGQTTVYDPNNGTAMIRVNGSLTLGANLTIRNTINAVAAFGTGSLTVNGATINALGFAISTNGSATGANASNGTVLAINSGTITSTDVAVYLPSGTMTINGGTITGSTGVYAKGGSLSVPSTSTAVITGNGADTGWSFNGNGANSTGDALVIDNSAYPYGPATATIAGGTYESTNGDAIGNYTKDAETLPTATGFVSGGTFSNAVAEEFCAEGFEPVDNGGTYGVRVDKGWIYEDADFPNYTGAWSKDGVALDLVYDSETGKAAIEDGATYTASKPSAGQLVTINLALSFDDVNDDEDGYEGAKAAIRLGEGETEGTYVFQLYTTNELGSAAWLNATASGVTPAVETDYEFTFVLDMTNKTFTATVDGVALTVDGAETLGFASANASDTVQSIEFTGSGKVASIAGSYEDPVPEGFVADETIGGVTLTAAQAEWLNGQGNYDALAAKLATMSQTALDNAYLLNLNIAGDFSYEFGVSDFKVDTAAGTATVYVTLTRTGALAENEVAKPIIGTLKLTGTAEIGTAFVEIGSADLTFDANADFGDGATTTAVTVDIGENGVGAKFYLPVIE